MKDKPRPGASLKSSASVMTPRWKSKSTRQRRKTTTREKIRSKGRTELKGFKLEHHCRQAFFVIKSHCFDLCSLFKIVFNSAF